MSLVSHLFSGDSLLRLMRGDLFAVVVKNYIAPSVCDFVISQCPQKSQIHNVKELYGHYLSGQGKLRLDLDVKWRWGASIATVRQDKMDAEFVKFYLLNKIMWPEAPATKLSECISTVVPYVLSADIVLKAPDSGVKIKLYRDDLSSEISSFSFFPTEEIVVERGDLVLSNAKRFREISPDEVQGGALAVVTDLLMTPDLSSPLQIYGVSGIMYPHEKV